MDMTKKEGETANTVLPSFFRLGGLALKMDLFYWFSLLDRLEQRLVLDNWD